MYTLDSSVTKSTDYKLNCESQIHTVGRIRKLPEFSGLVIK